MDIATGIQSLTQSLQDLRGAVHAGEHAQAEDLVARYDQGVRALFAEPVSPVSIQQITRLLALQHAVMDEMIVLRDTAAHHLGVGRQSRRAAHAYRSAESLA